MSYYEFKEEDAFLFARNHGPAKKAGSQLVFTICPYCGGGNHKDKHTFAIDLKTGQFNCRRGSCSAKGNMITLAKDFQDFDLGTDVQRYYNIDGFNDGFRAFRKAHIESKDEAVKYLKSRGISEEICRKYEITVRKDDENILVFPFRDENGSDEIVFTKYRNKNYVKGETPGSKEWCQKNCMPILFGMNHCESFGQLVITEGQIDSLSVAEAGVPNAVSVPTGKNGFTWVPHCWDWMNKFQTIVVFGDNEDGEITLAAELRKRFPEKLKVVKVEDYQGCKDANELLQKYGKSAIKKAVKNAEAAPIKHIKEMADVEAVDIESIPAISTGTGELDQILSGGFHYGDFVVLTGRRGDGKSTMASQFVVEALGKGENCFIYSGEMKDVAVKNWIDRQIIGRQTLMNSEIKQCEDWYRGRLFIYDDEIIDESETENLVKTVTEVIIQKNVKFILIDNLMTAMEDTSETYEKLYQQQSNFAGKLAKLARRLEVVILLICHPRKTTADALRNDDVSGSADITNKANIVLTYSRIFDRGQEANPALRNLNVIKNRLTGKLGSVRMAYLEDSKRIVLEKIKDIKKVYIQPKPEKVAEDEEIPF